MQDENFLSTLISVLRHRKKIDRIYQLQRFVSLQRSIMQDCEHRIKSLLAAVFENYKSLDENSVTGLSNIFGPISDFAAPALAPAVQIFSTMHDILSKEAQDILRSYLQVRY